MRKLALVVCAPVLLLSATASAHFTLESPPTPKGSVDGKGNPPCGPDNVDGVVTPVMGGSQLPIKIKETVRHGGFYRVALSLTTCKDKATCFPTDNKVYDSANKLLNPTGPGTSDHADFEASPKFPILGDNLFPHVQAGTAESYSGMVTLPNVTCEKCTLQVLEFMAPHGPNGANGIEGYFYRHCADLKITADPNKPIFDPNNPGGGGAGGAGAGGSGGAATGGSGGAATGGNATGGASGGSTSSAGTTSAAGAGGSGVNPTGGTGTATGGTGSTVGGAAGTGTTAPGGGGSSDDGGCGIAHSGRGGASALAALGLLLGLVRRRRSR